MPTPRPPARHLSARAYQEKVCQLLHTRLAAADATNKQLVEAAVRACLLASSYVPCSSPAFTAPAAAGVGCVQGRTR
jgi:hypothetical protein